MCNIQNVYAQDPITFIDENGERVSYGEQREWTRTIAYVFPDDSSKNYTVYQSTTGNEVWITSHSGNTEYHIGNNGECGWDSITSPYVDGYAADIQSVPEVDLYWHPELVNNNYVTVTYTPARPTVEMPAETPVPGKETPVPTDSGKTEMSTELAKSEDHAASQKTETPAVTVKEETTEKSGINWVIPGAVAIAGTISAVSYYVIKKLNLSGDDE